MRPMTANKRRAAVAGPKKAAMSSVRCAMSENSSASRIGSVIMDNALGAELIKSGDDEEASAANVVVATPTSSRYMESC